MTISTLKIAASENIASRAASLYAQAMSLTRESLEAALEAANDLQDRLLETANLSTTPAPMRDFLTRWAEENKNRMNTLQSLIERDRSLK
jgi:hypothetical protein